MFHLVLYEPEIPPNTGNIIRLCANAGAKLHLIEPLGFTLEDKQLRRAGLDYYEKTLLQIHTDLRAFEETVKPRRIFACSTRGQQLYSEVTYQAGDALLFGPETRGLPVSVLAELKSNHVLRIPMLPDNRSLNLSNAAAIVLFEAWRQHEFAGHDVSKF